jgi:P-type conjugative transfer protein TrbJ
MKRYLYILGLTLFIFINSNLLSYAQGALITYDASNHLQFVQMVQNQLKFIREIRNQVEYTKRSLERNIETVNLHRKNLEGLATADYSNIDALIDRTDDILDARNASQYIVNNINRRYKVLYNLGEESLSKIRTGKSTLKSVFNDKEVEARLEQAQIAMANAETERQKLEVNNRELQKVRQAILDAKDNDKGIVAKAEIANLISTMQAKELQSIKKLIADSNRLQASKEVVEAQKARAQSEQIDFMGKEALNRLRLLERRSDNYRINPSWVDTDN